jgi:hypothetical protein
VERLALVLGAFATLTTLVGWGVALAPDDRPRDPAAAWQVVERPGGTFAVPPRSSGWGVAAAREVIYYADRQGEALVGVSGPAVLDEGYCDEAADPSNRAFVGLTAPARGRVGSVNARLTRAWGAAVAATGREPTAARPERAVLADGSPAIRRHVVVPVAPGPCRPDRVALDLVSARGEAGVVTLVLVRDLGPGTVADGVARRILLSLAPYYR